ncbi:hypothetical protein, partial [Hafnia paralvei]|uniref:hypothetical protein n=1 Tax=Hafnia paralvei TaxID=546367 RepID=UPI0039B079E8
MMATVPPMRIIFTILWVVGWGKCTFRLSPPPFTGGSPVAGRQRGWPGCGVPGRVGRDAGPG